MASILAVSIDVEKLPKEKFVKGKKGTYYNFTVSVNDETRVFKNGETVTLQNVSVTDSQTKEERDAKAPKNYLGNGRVVWTNGKISLAEAPKDTNQPVEKKDEVTDDLPF